MMGSPMVKYCYCGQEVVIIDEVIYDASRQVVEVCPNPDCKTPLNDVNDLVFSQPVPFMHTGAAIPFAALPLSA